MMETDIATTLQDLARAATKPTAAAEPLAAPAAARADLQSTWIAVLREEWSSLAVVPTDATLSAREASATLAEIARSCRLRAVRAVDGTGLVPARVPALLDDIASSRGGDARVAVAVDNPVLSPAGVPVVLAADAALLLVRLGSSELRVVRAIAELVGRGRVVGCVLVG